VAGRGVPDPHRAAFVGGVGRRTRASWRPTNDRPVGCFRSSGGVGGKHPAVGWWSPRIRALRRWLRHGCRPAVVSSPLHNEGDQVDEDAALLGRPENCDYRPSVLPARVCRTRGHGRDPLQIGPARRSVSTDAFRRRLGASPHAVVALLCSRSWRMSRRVAMCAGSGRPVYCFSETLGGAVDFLARLLKLAIHQTRD
jgi:hypothetical protein